MKKLTITALAVAIAVLARAQTNPPTFIRGDMDIKFNTKIQTDSYGQPNKGAKDIYTLNVNVSDSAVFHGTISHTPLIINNGVLSSTVEQTRSLSYDMVCDVVNPKNPSQTRNVGRIFGKVPVDQGGAYLYGSLVCSVLPMGSAVGFDSKFGGVALGKPPGTKQVSGIQKAAMNIQRQVQGKTVTVVIRKYDKMVFQSHVLCAGPVQIYQEVTVNGEMVYDYDRYAWHFNNVTVQYAVGGVVKMDRLTGSIRWIEAPNRKTSGEGQYEFDIRVNEPPPSESAAFSSPEDESAFFVTDSAIPSLTGTMKYKDVFNSDGATVASAVKIDLTGNQLTKQQAMVLCKLLVFSSIVPMNSD